MLALIEKDDSTADARLLAAKKRLAEINAQAEAHWQELVGKFTAEQLAPIASLMREILVEFRNLRNEGDEWLTRRQAAAFLKINSRTLSILVARGEIRGERVGKLYRFSRNHLRHLGDR